jgi:hypothetical protein
MLACLLPIESTPEMMTIRVRTASACGGASYPNMDMDERAASSTPESIARTRRARPSGPLP